MAESKLYKVWKEESNGEERMLFIRMLCALYRPVIKRECDRIANIYKDKGEQSYDRQNKNMDANKT